METFGPIMGMAIYGLVIGWLTMFLVRRVEKFTVKDIIGLIPAVNGLVVLKIIPNFDVLWWWYPIGLLCGIIVHIFIALLGGASLSEVAYRRIFGPKKGG